MWEKHISARSTDFLIDEETGQAKLMNGSKQTIGGLISNIKVITTGSGQQMAYLTIEDFVGSVEVIMFSRNYQNIKDFLIRPTKYLLREEYRQMPTNQQDLRQTVL